ncbi:MAG: carboxypeptidase regulatory-like domain-containing protein [Candidatus Latescibacteria bacterium]|nr:carboxypeptidase regulatory-like domain-containing protein [Candidatus Latescibacterota bacterium]
MKKLLALLIFLVIAFVGCNSSTGDDDDNDNNGTGNDGKYTISGSVKLNSANGAGISGVNVALAPVSQSANPTPFLATTGSAGTFSFENISAGSYIVTVNKTDYSFTPEYVSISVSDKNVVTQTFIGTTFSNSGNAGTHSLFPFKTGATWTYSSVMSVSGFDINESEVDKVDGTMVKEGKTYWALDSTRYDSDGEESSNEISYVRIENNILYTYGADFLTAKAVAKVAKTAQAAALFKALESLNSDLAMIKFNVSAGTTWDVFRDSAATEGNSYSIVITGKYVGTETVGSYSNCAKYELEYDSESDTTYGKYAGKWSQTLWFSANVGIVKTVELFSSGETLATVTLLSTTTNMLESYQIP